MSQPNPEEIVSASEDTHKIIQIYTLHGEIYYVNIPLNLLPELEDGGIYKLANILEQYEPHTTHNVVLPYEYEQVMGSTTTIANHDTEEVDSSAKIHLVKQGDVKTCTVQSGDSSLFKETLCTEAPMDKRKQCPTDSPPATRLKVSGNSIESSAVCRHVAHLTPVKVPKGRSSIENLKDHENLHNFDCAKLSWRGEESSIIATGSSEKNHRHAVKVTNLPYGTWEDEVEDLFKRNLSVPSEGILNCIMDSTFTAATVNFACAEYVESALALNGMKYEEQIIKITVVHGPPSKSSLSLSKKVRFQNLPFGFTDNEFHDAIVDLLKQQKVDASTDFKCSMESSFTSGVVEFESPDIAEILLLCDGMEVQECHVSVSKILEEHPDIQIHGVEDNVEKEVRMPAELDNGLKVHTLVEGSLLDEQSLENLNVDSSDVDSEVAIKENDATKLIMRNLPPGLEDDDLRATVQYCLVANNLGSASDVNFCFMHTQTSAVVEFSSHEAAKKALGLSGTSAFGNTLNVSWFGLPQLTSDFDVFEDGGKNSCILSSEPADDIDVIDAEEDSSRQGNSNEPSIQSLDSEYNTLAFIAVTSEHKQRRPYAKWDTLYTLVIHDLAEKYGIFANTEDCTKKKKNLDDSFRKHRKRYGKFEIKWPFFCAMGRLRGENIQCMMAGHTTNDCPRQIIKHPEQTLVPLRNNSTRNSQTSESGSKPDDMASLSKGSFFSMEATKTLIHTVIAVAGNFDKMERNSAVWMNIKKAMDENGFCFEISKMMILFKNLVAKYKNYELSLSRTGQGRVDWDLYEDMRLLMGKSVAVTALLTAAVGSSNELIARSECSGVSNEGRVGKTKPATIPRKVRSGPDNSLEWRETVSQSLVKLVNHIVDSGSPSKL